MGVWSAMLGNAWTALAWALAAAAVAPLLKKRPEIRHSLWLLVLLRLLAPPVWTLPLPALPAAWTPERLSAAVSWPSASNWLSAPPPAAPLPAAPSAAAAVAPSAGRGFNVDPWAVACSAWALGSVAYFGVQAWRAWRFRRWMTGSGETPAELAAAFADIARRLNVDPPPRLRVVSAAVSPMLWGLGRRATVLFPAELLQRLAPEARDTLLAHELAHYRRGDHWVRLFEIVALGVFWWHPVAWWARRGIETAEEECCDSWVVGGLGASPRRYAEALLGAIDFLAEGAAGPVRRRVPAASGADRAANLLRSRLIALMDVEQPRRLRGGARLAVAATAFALPIQPPLVAAPARRTAPGMASVRLEPLLEGTRSLAKPDAPPLVFPAPTAPPLLPAAWARVASADGRQRLEARGSAVFLCGAGEFRLGPGDPLAAAFDPRRPRVVAAGPGPLLRSWSFAGDPRPEVRLPAAVRGVAFAPHADRLLAALADGTIMVLDAESFAEVGGFRVAGQPNSVAFSPDGATAAVAIGSWRDAAGRVELWDWRSARRLSTTRLPGPAAAAEFVGGGGATLAVGEWSGAVHWLELPAGRLLATRQMPKELAAAAAFAPGAASFPAEPPPRPPAPAPFLELALPIAWQTGNGAKP